jgi:hypothetical protein
MGGSTEFACRVRPCILTSLENPRQSRPCGAQPRTLGLDPRDGAENSEWPARGRTAEHCTDPHVLWIGPLLDVFMLDMRSYRGPNAEGLEETYGPGAYFLGPAQVAWLKRELELGGGQMKSEHQPHAIPQTSNLTVFCASRIDDLSRRRCSLASAVKWPCR